MQHLSLSGLKLHLAPPMDISGDSGVSPQRIFCSAYLLVVCGKKSAACVHELPLVVQGPILNERGQLKFKFI